MRPWAKQSASRCGPAVWWCGHRVGYPAVFLLDSPSHQSVPRNVLVIRTLRFFGVAEDAGRGVDPMHRHTALNLMVSLDFSCGGLH